MKSVIKNYKKWAQIALTQDPLLEVGRFEGEHLGIPQIIRLLRVTNKKSKNVRCRDTEVFGCIETIRFHSGNEGFAKFAKAILTKEFYPGRGSRLECLYLQPRYNNQMVRWWEQLQDIPLGLVKKAYRSPELRRELQKLRNSYPQETRKHLLLAVAAYKVIKTMDKAGVAWETTDSDTDSGPGGDPDSSSEYSE